MSQDALMRVLERAMKDAGFRTQLKSNPDSALAGYDLTPDERAALLSADSGQLASLGVDERITKSVRKD